MSYDIRLKDPVTDETLDLPVKHVMTGGTYQADYDEQTRTFSPKPISEGPCDDYWEATAANAIRPLHQLIAMAKLRPDGVWDGD